MVSATSSGRWPKPFSRSAITGSATAPATARAFSSMSSREARPSPSGQPRANITPALLVSTTPKPTCASSRAVPASQQLPARNAPGAACRARSRRGLFPLRRHPARPIRRPASWPPPRAPGRPARSPCRAPWGQAVGVHRHPPDHLVMRVHHLVQAEHVHLRVAPPLNVLHMIDRRLGGLERE